MVDLTLSSNMQCTPVNSVGYDNVFNGCENGVMYVCSLLFWSCIYIYRFCSMILLVLLSRFDITDHCVGIHSCQVSYSNVLLLYLVYKSVINI